MSNYIEQNKIKLIILDLDDTFWNGTLSEENIEEIPANIKFVKDLVDKGIMVSVCSKNDYNQAKEMLECLDVWDYLVFPSINWKPKGQRIKNLICNMQLREENVLFIDDNSSNLNEAIYYCPKVHTMLPIEIKCLAEELLLIEKNDSDHARLKQYKTLEKKQIKRQTYSSNYEFLVESDIKCEILNDFTDCIDRIYDLIHRTNQLNYTKKRITKDELVKIISNAEYDCGYVKVRDNFGDYGIVGFYACKNNRLDHFLFSCRTMGMGIEQYVYSQLKYPKLDVTGDVANQVESGIEVSWINRNDSRNISETKIRKYKVNVLAKGPCDMQQVFSYIKNSESFVNTEYSFVEPKNGVLIESHNSTTHIVESQTISQYAQEKIIQEVPFSSDNLFLTDIFSGKYDIVFLSLFTDGGHGLYQRKETGELVSFGEYYYDLTDEKNWNEYMSGKIFNANMVLKKNELVSFKKNYEFKGRIEISQILQNLTYIRKYIKTETKLVLFLGSELIYYKNKQPAYNDRHLFNKELNKAVYKWAADYNNVKIIDFNYYITGQKDYFNNINHFVKRIYYEVSKDVADILSDYSEQSINTRSKKYFCFTAAKQRFWMPIYERLSKVKRAFKNFLNV